jgi:hypothetical protein
VSTQQYRIESVWSTPAGERVTYVTTIGSIEPSRGAVIDRDIGEAGDVVRVEDHDITWDCERGFPVEQEAR